MDRERKAFKLLPADLQALIGPQIGYGGSYYQWLREKVGLVPSAPGVTETTTAVVTPEAGTTSSVSFPNESGRLPHKSLTPEHVYHPYILRYLLSQPKHSAMPKQVINAIITEMNAKKLFTEFDLTDNGRGALRAANRIEFARNTLKEMGLLKNPKTDPSAYGRWTLTTAGVREAKEYAAKKK